MFQKWLFEGNFQHFSRIPNRLHFQDYVFDLLDKYTKFQKLECRQSRLQSCSRLHRYFQSWDWSRQHSLYKYWHHRSYSKCYKFMYKTHIPDFKDSVSRIHPYNYSRFLPFLCYYQLNMSCIGRSWCNQDMSMDNLDIDLLRIKSDLMDRIQVNTDLDTFTNLSRNIWSFQGICSVNKSHSSKIRYWVRIISQSLSCFSSAKEFKCLKLHRFWNSNCRIPSLRG